MFGGRFGLTRFSLRAGSEMIAWIEESYREIGNSLISFGSAFAIDEIYRCRIEGSLAAVRGLPTVEAYQDRTHALVNAIRGLLIKEIYAEQSRGDLSLGANLFANEIFREAAGFDSRIIANVYAMDSMRENGGATIFGGIEFGLSDAFREKALAVVNATGIEILILTISALIPPGGELRIDGENYNVLLNDENIIHLHSGAWPVIDRRIISLTLTSASESGLSGQILYNERYL